MLPVVITEKKKKRLYKVMNVLTNLLMVIISQCTCISVQIITLYTLNLHDDVCQFYFSKAEGIKTKTDEMGGVRLYCFRVLGC